MTSCQLAITTCSSNLLHIVLNTSWQVEVNHRGDVTDVNSHRESNSATEHSNLLRLELLYGVSTLLIRLLSVVGASWDSILIQEVCQSVIGSSLSSVDQYRVHVLVSISLK